MPATAPEPGTGPALPVRDLANAIRALAMDAVEAAKSGHPGMPMGMADAATVLFTRFLKYDPARPDWPDRDRFVLSAGHGSMLLYALLHLTGYERVTLEEIRNFRQLGSLTAGHPEVDLEAGIETTTGPLGQGISNAVGMALAERILNARFGDALVDHRTYVLASDGDLMEGVSHEACSLAGHLRLSRLIVLYDDNHISIDGPTSLSFSDDTGRRFEGYGWATAAVDGHDPEAVAAALEAAQTSDRPTLIACRTTIGFGAPTKAGTAGAHGAPLGPEEVAGARERLGWTHPPFEVPDDIRETWRTAGGAHRETREAWEARAAGHAERAAFERALAGDLGARVTQAIGPLKQSLAEEAPTLATRQASGKVLEVLVPAIPELMGGSGDLTPSNNTRTANVKDIAPGDYGGRYIRYGVREHGMAAIMNGLALHGGVVPYGGTFLTFTDYCRPSIRLSALMGQRVVYVMTHDSIGLGEDGPTHQPVEHLAALRAIPNLAVFRPADAIETAECWELALTRTDGPSVIALTRQGVPALRQDIAESRSARGAYVLSDCEAAPQATLLATGSEVSLAVEAQRLLAEKGIGARVVSMPCWELFEAQGPAYIREVLGEAPIRVGIEAAVRSGWDRWLGPDGVFVGMSGFGASAPAKALYQHFGITADAVARAVEGAVADALSTHG